MPKKNIPKIIPLLLLTTLLVIPTTAIPLTTQQTSLTTQTEPRTQQPTLTTAEQEYILTQLTENNTNRYITISAGIRATSFFLKIPRPLTQRGITFIAEIKYRSPLAFTLVLERSPQNGTSINAFERGTHRLIVIGIGHAAFSRPHVGSFGHYTGLSKTEPIVF